ELQTAARPAIGLLPASLAVAVNWSDWLTRTTGVAGVMVTDVTVAEVTAISPLIERPLLTAVKVVFPTATPVMVVLGAPVFVTVAMVAFPLENATEGELTTFPAASRTVAEDCAVPPTAIATDIGTSVI